MVLYKKNGSFTAKSAYLTDQNIRFAQSQLRPRDWKAFWRAPMHDRHKLLLWEVINSSLPLRTILSTRMPLQDLSCLLCFNREESLNQLFIDCSFSRLVWSLIKYPVRLQCIQSITVVKCIKIAMGIDKSFTVPPDIAHSFLLQAAITFHVLWRRRNPLIQLEAMPDPALVASSVI